MQDYGPPASSEDSYERVLEPKLADMSVPIRPPILRAVPLSQSQHDAEPDSTNPENIVLRNKLNEKEAEYDIDDKVNDLPVGTLSGIVRIEDGALDSLGRVAYPIVEEEANDGYANCTPTIIQAPINTAIVQNVAKLPHNYSAINVDATNITTLQTLSQEVTAGQTIWVPTLLTTTTATIDNKNSEEDRSQTGVSQIIIASENYEGAQMARRGSAPSDPSYISRPKNSKVQIISNISLPKNSSYSHPQQYLPPKEAPTYATQNHVYKLGTNVSQKHLNNSVVCTKPSKTQSVIGCPTVSSVISNSIKSVTYTQTISKSLNKVNNGANLNAMAAATSGNSQCHIVPRVVSGSNKVTLHSTKKTVNALKGSKSGAGAGSNSQKTQSRAIKIIQQAGSVSKSEGKTWSSSITTYKNQSSYGVIDTCNSKIIQKVGSPHKNQSAPLPKVANKGERLVLQSPCVPVLMSTTTLSSNLPKPPHYVQAGPTPNLRYVHTYSTESSQVSNVSQMTANQQLTAQILQSLSQPKTMLHSSHILNRSITPPPVEKNAELSPVNQKRIIL